MLRLKPLSKLRIFGKTGHFDEILGLSEPAYTENTSKWGRFEFGLLASEDAELTMPHHFEEASVYTENTSKWGRFEFGLLASADAELTMPHHFEDAP